MGRGTRWLVAWMLAVGGFSGSAAAATEVEILMNKLVERGVLTIDDAQAIRQEIAEAQAMTTQPLADEAAPSLEPLVSLNGELRLRNEYRDRTGASNAHRQRIRFRLGVKAKVSPALEVGARLATGTAPGDLSEGSDPVSTNQTLSDTFAKKSFNLDAAYVKYSPETFVDGVAVWGGIFDNPFVSTSLVWDSDLTFGGAAVQFSHTFGPVQPFLNGGVFPIDSDGFGTDNPALYGIQGGIVLPPALHTEVELLDHLRLKPSVAYYDYSNAVKNTLINTQAGNTASAEDFNEVNPSFEATSRLFNGVPIAFWSDWVHNTAAPEQAGGFQVGLKLGKALTPWNLKSGWEAGYFYERLDADAVFDGFVDSDFGGGGTNHKGNVWWLTLATVKNSTVTTKYASADEVKGAKSHENRWQLDWVTKF